MDRYFKYLTIRKVWVVINSKECFIIGVGFRGFLLCYVVFFSCCVVEIYGNMGKDCGVIVIIN